MLWQWIQRLSAVLGILGTMLAIALAWNGIRDKSSDWLGVFYPEGIIAVLAATAVFAAWVAWRSRRTVRSSSEPPPVTNEDEERQRDHDRRVVAEIRRLVSREGIEWLRRWDFGGSWEGEHVNPYYDLRDRDDVEHRVFDRELGNALRYLLDATAEFVSSLNHHSFPEHRVGRDWRNVGWSGGEADGLSGEQRRIWEERRDLLNGTADDVVAAYDEFIDVARRKLLLS